jgi:hypothetical protein
MVVLFVCVCDATSGAYLGTDAIAVIAGWHFAQAKIKSQWLKCGQSCCMRRRIVFDI